MKTNKIKESAFRLMLELLDSAGGDGNVLVVCGDYRRVADEFEKWLNINEPNYLQRLGCEKWVDFHREQADLWITDRNGSVDLDNDLLDGKIVIDELYELSSR